MIPASVFTFKSLNIDDKSSIKTVLKEDCEKKEYKLGVTNNSIEVRKNVAFVNSATCFPTGVSGGEGYVVFLKKSSGQWKILDRISGPVPSITKTQLNNLEKEGVPNEWFKDFLVE